MSVVFPVSYTDRQTKCTKGSNPQPLPERDLGATLGNSVEDGRQRQRRAGLSGIFFFVCFLFSARPPSRVSWLSRAAERLRSWRDAHALRGSRTSLVDGHCN